MLGRVARGLAGGLVMTWCLSLPSVRARAETGPARAEARRSPVSAAVSHDGRWLYVANRESGTVSTLEAQSGRVVSETVAGQRLAQIVLLEPYLLAVLDDQLHRLTLWSCDDEQLTEVATVTTSAFPQRLAWAADRQLLWVSCLWSRQVCCFGVDAARKTLTPFGTVDLSFAPRAVKWLEQYQRLLVIDGFGGAYAVLRPDPPAVVHIGTLPAHNIGDVESPRGSSMLVFAQQTLSELAQTINPDVHWGVLMSNDLRWLRTDRVLEPQTSAVDVFVDAHIHGIGEPNRAAGDPGDLALRSDGLILVTLGGVDELALGYEDDSRFRRVAVGDRPTSVCVAPDGARAYVTNYFDDSVSVVDLARVKVVATWSLGLPAPDDAVRAGERLFYDAHLSLDGWMSCHSCHTDGHSAGLLNDNFSDGTFGAPKRILSLMGVADTAPYAWNGRTETLEQQIGKSVEQTMQGDRPLAPEQRGQLAAFLRQLEPPPAVAVARQAMDEQRVLAGREIFEQQRCFACHRPPSYTSPGTFDVGLQDEQGRSRFNPPSLRGVSQRGPYFHDNRAATLRAVFLEHRHRLGEEVTAQQVADLLAFLESL